MTRDEALTQLNTEGEDAGSDYNDALDADFGWTVEGDLLTINHTKWEFADPYDDRGKQLSTEVFRFRLVPID